MHEYSHVSEALQKTNFSKQYDFKRIMMKLAKSLAIRAESVRWNKTGRQKKIT